MKVIYRQDQKQLPVSHDPHIQKQVLLTRQDGIGSGLTQLAVAIVAKGQSVTKHTHPDMMEVFYVTRGLGTAVINDSEPISLVPGATLRVDPQEPHCIKADPDHDLEIVYFGIQMQ